MNLFRGVAYHCFTIERNEITISYLDGNIAGIDILDRHTDSEICFKNFRLYKKLMVLLDYAFTFSAREAAYIAKRKELQ